MTVSSFALYLGNRIQEAQQITLNQLSIKTGRSVATIRRTVHSLNECLQPSLQFVVTESKIINQMSYDAFVSFIQGLSINDFSPAWKERLELLYIITMIDNKANLTKLYQTLEISQSTKKKDRATFSKELEKGQLSLLSLRGKGVTIVGDELTLRIKTAQILSQVIELNEENQIISRQATNPVQQLIYQYAKNLFKKDSNKQRLNNLLREYQLSFNYTSMKFLYVYYFISLHRTENNYFITKKHASPVKIQTFSLFNQAEENFSFSNVLASLDNNGENFYPKDELVISIRKQFVQYVEERIITTFYSREELDQEIEQYLYKCLVRNFLDYDFYDNKLDDVKKEFSFLYQLVDYCYQEYLPRGIKLDQYQLSTLTLLFRNHVLKNKIAGRNLKKVVVITNSAKEKGNFFSQQLVYFFDTKVIAILNINEIYQLKNLKYDNLITFSNRISTILDENGFSNIKVNYYFHSEDIEYLAKLNFSYNFQRKIITEQFVNEIKEISAENLTSYLKEHYANFFV
ncbi:helix-turn-helix domain-containing protein [Tetragenococcus halophilus]|uniref:helix-turn-helix domain-containing protein n=1 Tax=Tetragenococcus halophilus TaxID=51669 RepID=UPI000CC8439A|nr:helix-turn-helix domain-containing protein [Tetragenococcus halophilus]WJS82590.1 helix-turn-helix domain-containing protein [Tetragenococcus halophilus]GBD73536.1 hypothetical protein TEHN7125_1696 [Tetragenococcus halophilus subsp. halophilus]GBD74899.1 hypothetical protein TEHN7126_0598 [Tetragenococcus halophilus subsp. halophilus]